MEKIEGIVRGCQLDASDIPCILSRLMMKIESFLLISPIKRTFAEVDDDILTKFALIEKANDIQNCAMHDGEMQVAEDQMWTKLDLVEKLMVLV